MLGPGSLGPHSLVGHTTMDDANPRRSPERPKPLKSSFTGRKLSCKLVLSDAFMKKQRPKIKQMPDILTLQQACEILNCHPNTLRKWDNNGYLKAIRFGRRGDRRYRKKDILGLLKKTN